MTEIRKITFIGHIMCDHFILNIMEKVIILKDPKMKISTTLLDNNKCNKI